MEAAAGEDGEEPLRSAQVLGSELVETYTVMAAALVPCRFALRGAALAFGGASPRGRRGREAASGVCCWE